MGASEQKKRGRPRRRRLVDRVDVHVTVKRDLYDWMYAHSEVHGFSNLLDRAIEQEQRRLAALERAKGPRAGDYQT